MARTVTIDIRTTANLGALNSMIGAVQRLQRELRSLATTANTLNKAMAPITKESRNAVNALKNVSTATDKVRQSTRMAVRDYDGLMTALRRATQITNTLNKATDQATTLNKRLNAAERQLTDTKQNQVDAQRRYMQLISSGGGTKQEIAYAERRLALAKQGVAASEKTVAQIKQEVAAYKTAHTQYERLGAVIEKIQSLGKQPPTQLLNQYQKLGEAIEGYGRQLGNVQNIQEAENRLNAIATSGIKGRVTQVQNLVPVLADATTAQKKLNAELQAAEKADLKWADTLDDDLRKITSETKEATTANVTFRSALTTLNTALNSVLSTARSLSTAIGTALRSSLTNAANAARGFANTSASLFSGLQRSVQGVGSAFQTFGRLVTTSLNPATRSVKDFYNAGWAMGAAGIAVQNFGQNIFRTMGRSLEQYMAYEKALTRLAISAQVTEGSAAEQAGYAPGIYPDWMQQFVFGLQRGQFTTDEQGRPLPIMQFSAEELAQGLYYYTSAIGQPVTPQNMGDVGQIASQILQMAAATQTSLETAMKGAFNIAMEFGIDPRLASMGDPVMGEWMRRVPALMAYLANISTMEVPDIAETFKMVGPMAHILSPDRGPGGGLLETMALTFLASEMGLRGGNVGRGVNQALTTLLDPTDKAIAAAANAWGTAFGEATEENWRAFFFDETGALEGGLPGFFEKLASLPAETAAPLLAEIFTTNATRALIAIQEAMKRPGGIQGIIDDLAGENPMRFLSEAFLETNNTIFTNMQNLKSAWFALVAEIVGAIKGPFMGALRGLADMFWNISDSIRENPWIGQFVAGLLTIVAGVATVVGSLLMLGGTVLLVLKAFSMMGGMAGPFLLFLLSVGKALLILVPIFAAVAIASALLMSAWENDFMGMRTTIQGFVKDFSFDKSIVPVLERIGGAIRYTAAAFKEFATGIVGGFGSTAVFGKWLEDVFGPILGPVFYGHMLRFSDALDNLREKVRDFLTGIGDNRAINGIKSLTGALQGFFEFLFTGMLQGQNLEAWNNVMEMFGFEQGTGNLLRARDAFAGFIASIINGITALRNQLSPILQEIGDNLEDIFTRDNLITALQFLQSFIEGTFIGIGAIIVGVVSAFELLTEAVSNVGSAASWINDWIERLTGLRLAMDDVATTAGILFGLWLGTRMVASLLPGFTLLTNMIPLVANLTASFIGLSGVLVTSTIRFAALVLQALAATIAFGLQLTVVGLLGLAFGGLLAVLGLIVGAMFLAAYEANGLSGIMDGLTNIALGFAAVMVPVVVAIGVFISHVLTAVLGLDELTGSASTFQMVGAALAAVILGIAAAVALMATATAIQAVAAIVSAIASTVAWVAAFLPLGVAIGLVIGALGLFVVVLWQVADGIRSIDFGAIIGDLVGDLKLFWEILQFSDAPLEDIAQGINIRIRYIFAVVLRAFAFELYQLAERIQGHMRENTLLKPLYNMLGIDDESDGAIVSAAHGFFQKTGNVLARATEDVINYQNQMTDKIAANKFSEKLLNSLNPFSDVEGGTTWEIGGFEIDIDAILERFGLSGLFEEGGDLSPMVILEKLGYEQFDATIGQAIEQATGVTTDQLMKSQYDKQMEAWRAYEQLVRTQGAAFAASFYEANNIPIPTNPGRYDEWMADQVGQLEEVEKTLAERAAEMNTQLISSLTGMDIPAAIKGMFGTGSIADVLTQVGDQIMENIGDAGPWLNMTELLADAAGMGLLGLDISGQNIHEALRPALTIVAQQTGMSINDIMKGIPKYIVPQEFIPLATAELLEGLNGLGQELYLTVESLGMDYLNDAGLAMEENGLQWAELTAFAVGQAIAGQDWDLATYLASSWNISYDEATEYLKTKGIFDPNVIGDEWFEDTEMLIASMGGQVSLITEEWMSWLDASLTDANDKTIELTRSAFDALPDYVKIGFSNMGYTFVVGAQTVAGKMYESAMIVVDAFVDAYGPVREEISRWSTETGQEMVTFRNAAGEEITVTAPEYDAYIQALEDIRKATEDTRKVMEGIGRPLRGDATGGPGMDAGLETPGATTAPRLPGLPTAGEVRTQVQEVVSVANEELGKLSTNIQPTFEGAATTLSSAFGTQLRTDLPRELQTAFFAMGSADMTGPRSMGRLAAWNVNDGFAMDLRTSMTQTLTSALYGLGGAAMEGPRSMGRLAAWNIADTFSSQLKSDLTEKLQAALYSLGGASMEGPRSIGRLAAWNVADAFGTALKEQLPGQLSAAMANINAPTNVGEGIAGDVSALSGTSVTINIYANTSVFDDALARVTQAAGNFARTTYKTQFDAGTTLFDSAYESVTTRAKNFVNTTYKTALDAEPILFNNVLDTAQKAGSAFDKIIYSPWFDAEPLLFNNALDAAQKAGSGFDKAIYSPMLSAETWMFYDALGGAQQSAKNFVNTQYTTSLSAATWAFYDALEGVRQSAKNFVNTSYTTSLSASTGAFWNAINSIPYVVANRVINVYYQPVNTGLAAYPHAAGGTVKAPVQLVGERGPEITQQPIGTRVYSNSRSMGMIRDAVRYELQGTMIPLQLDIQAATHPRDTGSLSISTMSRAMRAVEVQRQGSGEVNVEIHNLVINKEVDIDNAIERIDRATGRRMELNRRGQGTYEESLTV